MIKLGSIESFDIFLRILTVIGFITLILIQFIKKRKKVLLDPYLIASMFLGLIGFFIYFLDIIFWMKYQSPEFRIIFHSLSYGFLILFIFALYKHYEAIANSSKNNWLDYILIFFVNMVWFVIILHLFSKYIASDISIYSNIQIFSPIIVVTLVSFPTWFSGVLIFGYTSILAFQIKNFNKKLPTEMEFFVNILLFVIFTVMATEDVLITAGKITDQIAYTVVVISLFCLNVALIFLISIYLLFPSYLFYLPHSVEQILIYNQSGIAIYYKKFKTESNLTLHSTNLIPGLFTAISILFEESLGNKAILNEISLHGFKILFIPILETKGTLALITKKGNYFLYKGMQKFVDILPFEIENKFNDTVFKISESESKILDDTVQNSFPFLSFDV